FGASPSIRPNYLATARDRRVAAEAIRLTRRIMAAKPMEPHAPEELRPGIARPGDEDLARAAGEIGPTIFHPVGTARIGSDASPAGSMTRAVQGHSTPVTLGHPTAAPPEPLYRGTVERSLPDILRDGRKPGARHDVHLSPDEATAGRVGARRGRPVVLVIQAGA